MHLILVHSLLKSQNWWFEKNILHVSENILLWSLKCVRLEQIYTIVCWLGSCWNLRIGDLRKTHYRYIKYEYLNVFNLSKSIQSFTGFVGILFYLFDVIVCMECRMCLIQMLWIHIIALYNLCKSRISWFEKHITDKLKHIIVIIEICSTWANP